MKGISPSGMLVLSVACLFFVSAVAATLVHGPWLKCLGGSGITCIFLSHIYCTNVLTLALLIEISFLVDIKLKKNYIFLLYLLIWLIQISFLTSEGEVTTSCRHTQAIDLVMFFILFLAFLLN